MNVESAPVKLQPGSIVRIHGRPWIVGQLSESGWSFASKDGKGQLHYTFQALRNMLRKQQLTSENAYRALSRNAQEALTLDWGSFTIVEQMSAYRKRPFVEAVDKLPTRHRDKRKYLKGLIGETNARAEDPFPMLPAPRRVRDWYCVMKTPVRRRRAVREMKEDPSEPLCRRRLQTAMSCFGQKPRW